MRQSRKARLGLSVCAAALACAGALYLYFMGPGNVPLICVFHEITGLYCPGCGAGRACYSILHGEFLEAFCYNPLMTVLLPLIGLYIAARMADWIIRNTPKDSVFYYNGGFANFMASLTGRQVYCVGKKVCEHEGLSCDGREDLENLSVLAGQVQYVILNEKESESFKVRASSAWKQLFPAGALRLFGRVE